MRAPAVALCLSMFTSASIAQPATDNSASAAPAKTMGDVLAQSTEQDWRTPDPERLLYLDIPSGRVVIELAPDFAPKHVANLRALSHSKYFDGLAILRSQDNFVVQWGDPEAESAEKRRTVGRAKRTLDAEFERPIDEKQNFTQLPDGDGYAPQVGFSDGFPVGRDPKAGMTWLAHCYGTLGVGRDNSANSGGGTELYVVTGHAPRQLDRNITVVGRVLKGMELLSTLKRGTGALGFYENADERTTIQSVRIASEIPEADRVAIEVMRTDSASFTQLIETRRNRRDDWYKRPAGFIDLCSVPIPVRAKVSP